jgi:mannitol-specific phosphotransferase system IIBC component
MSLPMDAIIGLSVAAAAVAIVSGGLLFRKKHSSPSNTVEESNLVDNLERQKERTKAAIAFSNDEITLAEFGELMKKSAARGKGKKTKGRKSNRKKQSYKKK